MRRLVSLTVIVGVFMAIPAVAFAHECVAANRSDKGIENSDRGMWFAVNTDDFIMLVFEDDPETGEAILAAYGDAFEAAVAAEGLPTSFSIFEHHTIGAKGAHSEEFAAAYVGTGKSSDGKGIDHFFTGGYVETYLKILFGLIV
jgi:hypothetical protein